jgi:hypothetical protein
MVEKVTKEILQKVNGVKDGHNKQKIEENNLFF